ncbi:MAG: DMT family transporter [Oscillospiraceae bacterium]|jgi:drug/metabolite transporter (DMT)-like permease|nr:DMT family transporter [Oscillospiraceae bacterium]
MSLPKARNQAVLLMIGSAVLWSTGGVLIKLLPWNPFVISGFRSLFAAAVIYIYIRHMGIKIRVNRNSMLNCLFLGGLMFTFVVANKLTTAANAIVLEYSSPAFIVLFSAVFFKQRFHLADVIAVAGTMAGIAMFFLDRLTCGSLLGNCVALFSGVLMALSFLVSARADMDTRMSGILFAHLAAAAVGVPLAFFYPPAVTAPAAAGILALGIFQIGVPYVLYGLAMKNCPPLACSLIGTLEPLLNPIWVYLFFGEAPGRYALFGGVVVLISITGWCVWRDHFIAAHSST